MSGRCIHFSSLLIVATLASLVSGSSLRAQTSANPARDGQPPQSVGSQRDSSASVNYDTVTQVPIEALGDLQGVDVSPYLKDIQTRVRKNWYTLVPYAHGIPSGNVGIEFAIARDGQVSNLKVVAPSGDSLFDKAAVGGITLSAPFPPLPPEFKGKILCMRFRFYYYANPSEMALANAVRDVQARFQENLDGDNGLADLDHDVSVFSLLMDTGSLNKVDETAARYYRASAVSRMNAIRKHLGQTMDLPAAQQALDDLDKLIASDNDIPSWNVSIGNAEYLAGGIAFNQTQSDSIAYSYWEKCSEKGHAGCMNTIATGSVTGEGGETVNLNRALDLHNRVFETGVKYSCAGAFSARSIARIVYFTGTRRPGDDELEWIRKSYPLSDQVEAHPKAKDRCDGASARIEEFLYRLGRGERRPDLLTEATARLDDDSPVDTAVIQYLLGSIDDNEFEAAVQTGKTVPARCYGYFTGMWYAELMKKPAIARKYYQRLSDTGQIECRIDLVYAKKFQF